MYGIVMCFNLHKQYCTINLVLFLSSLNILFLRDPAMLPYVDLIHSSGPSYTCITFFLFIPLGDGTLGCLQSSATTSLQWAVSYMSF